VGTCDCILTLAVTLGANQFPSLIASVTVPEPGQACMSVNTADSLRSPVPCLSHVQLPHDNAAMMPAADESHQFDSRPTCYGYLYRDRNTRCRYPMPVYLHFSAHNTLTPTVAIWVLGTAIKHPVSDRVKTSFVIFDIRAL